MPATVQEHDHVPNMKSETEPKRTGEGPKPHPHDSTLGESSREAQSG